MTLWCFVLPLMAGLAMVILVPAMFGMREVLFGIDSRDRRRVGVGAAVLAIFVAGSGLVCVSPFRSLRMCLQAPYSPPPATVGEIDLVGTWEAHYGRSVDRLMLSPDGTFKQVYTSGYVEGYVYETGWNSWGVQRLGDGRVRVRLEGARFYPDGIAVAEEGGWGHGTQSFYDPITVRPVDMDGRLVLNVRVDPGGELILYHMWSTGDQGFAMTGCEMDFFRRVETR
jgi:hypothetical protein